MTPEQKDQLVKRLKAYAWRAGCVAAVAVLNFTSEQLTTISLPSWAATAIGLAIGEVTKWLNNHTTLFGAQLK